MKSSLQTRVASSLMRANSRLYREAYRRADSATEDMFVFILLKEVKKCEVLFTVYSWTFKFHKVVRQHNSDAVEDFILSYSAVYLRIPKWKNYWNRSTFAKVIVKIKVAPYFMAHGVFAVDNDKSNLSLFDLQRNRRRRKRPLIGTLLLFW